ncbi:hypothetical protein MT418_000476 [Batrachochytrium dendrobatidis]
MLVVPVVSTTDANMPLLSLADALVIPQNARVFFVYNDLVHLDASLLPVSSNQLIGQSFTARLCWPDATAIKPQQEQTKIHRVGSVSDLESIVVSGTIYQLASSAVNGADAVPTVWLAVHTCLTSCAQLLALSLSVSELLKKSKAHSLHVFTVVQYKTAKDAVHVLEMNGIDDAVSLEQSGTRLDCPLLVRDAFINSMVELVRLYKIPSRFMIWPATMCMVNSKQALSALSQEISRVYDIPTTTTETATTANSDPMTVPGHQIIHSAMPLLYPNRDSESIYL